MHSYSGVVEFPRWVPSGGALLLCLSFWAGVGKPLPHIELAPLLCALAGWAGGSASWVLAAVGMPWRIPKKTMAW